LAQFSSFVKQLLAQKSITEMEHPTHPIPLIWLQIISGCFQKYSLPSRNEDFGMLKTSKENVATTLKAIP
jgi:hypothetical protein